jgi:hypothetical protein
MRDERHRKPVQIGPRARHDGGYRSSSSIDYIVIHDAEGASAQAVARYGATTARVVSWHVVCDDEILIRCLPDLVIAWAAPPLNTHGLQLELCGYARWSKLTWYLHQGTLKRGAWQVARWCRQYGIPARWLTNAELADGKREGIVTHAQVSAVFSKSDHTDPGKNFPQRYFMYLVRRRVRWLEKASLGI